MTTQSPGADARQRVLLVHRYFSPDATTYARMLEVFAAALAERGHDVTVLCGPPSYNGVYDGPPVPTSEHMSGFMVRRFRMPVGSGRIGRVVDLALFPLLVLLHVLTRRVPYEVVSVTTMPPVVMGVVGRLAKLRARSTRFVYHCMDLYPEAALLQGMLTPGLLSRIAAWLDSTSVRRADRVIVLSSDMKHTLEKRSAGSAIAVCNNFILERFDAELESAVVAKDSAPGRFLFAGNLGKFQGIPELLDGVAMYNDSANAPVQLSFLGAGALAGQVQSRSQSNDSVTIAPPVDLRQAMVELARSDYSVVSLAPGIATAAYPSKLMTSLEVGSPVLAVVEPDSDLGRFVTENNVGVVCEPGSPAAVARGIEEITRKQWDAEHIRAVGSRSFDRDAVLRQWAELYGLA